jgi:hypothetical protein
VDTEEAFNPREAYNFKAQELNHEERVAMGQASEEEDDDDGLVPVQDAW